MGNQHAYPKYDSGYTREQRMSWSNLDGEPRIFTPYDNEASPGVEPHYGLVLKQKTVRFILGRVEEIPEYLPATSPHLHPTQRKFMKAARDTILTNKPKGILKNPIHISTEKRKKPTRRIFVTERLISNTNVIVVPFYFTKHGPPGQDRQLISLDRIPRHQSTDLEDPSSTAPRLGEERRCLVGKRVCGDETSDSVESASSEGPAPPASEASAEASAEIRQRRARESFELPSWNGKDNLPTIHEEKQGECNVSLEDDVETRI